MKGAAVSLLLVSLAHPAAASDDDVLWRRSFGGPQSDGGRSIAATADGGFVIAGYTDSFGAGCSDLLLLVTDREGREVVTVAVGGVGWEAGYDAAQTPDGGFVATGFTTSSSLAGDRDLYLVRLDSAGRVLWTRAYGGPGSDVGRSVVVTADGGFAVAGTTDSRGAGETDLWLLRTDAEGAELWSRTYGGPLADDGRGLLATAGGGFLLVGASGSYGDGNRNLYLVATDSDGTEQWTSSLGSAGSFEWGEAVAVTSDGGFFAAGSADRHGSDLHAAYVVRTDAAGRRRWARWLGETTYNDYGADCLATADDEVVVVGTTCDPATLSEDLYLRRVAADGRNRWTEILGGPGSQWGRAVLATDRGYVVVGDTDNGGGGARDVLLLELSNLWPDFAVIPASGTAPLTVQVDDRSLGTVTSWRWDFDGDGEFDATGPTPEWTYRRPGTYAVTLEISDGHHTRSRTVETAVRVALDPTAPRQPSGRLGP